MRKLSWARVAAWRSARHHLDRRAPAGSMVARVAEQTREQVQRAAGECRAFLGGSLRLAWRC